MRTNEAFRKINEEARVVPFDCAWPFLMLIREHSEWTGQTYEIEVAGRSIILYGRRDKMKDAFGHKLPDMTMIIVARKDEAWGVIYDGIGMPDLPLKRVGYKNYHQLVAEQKIIFGRRGCRVYGDYELFKHDMTLIRLFGDF